MVQAGIFQAGSWFVDVDQNHSGCLAGARHGSCVLAVLAHSRHVCACRACTGRVSPQSHLACTVNQVCGGAQNRVDVLKSTDCREGRNRLVRCAAPFSSVVSKDPLPAPLMPLSQPSVKRSYSCKRTISLGDGNHGGSGSDAEGSVANFIHRRFQLASVSARYDLLRVDHSQREARIRHFGNRFSYRDGVQQCLNACIGQNFSCRWHQRQFRLVQPPSVKRQFVLYARFSSIVLRQWNPRRRQSGAITCAGIAEG